MFPFLEAGEMMSQGDAKAQLAPGSQRVEVDLTRTPADTTPRALEWHTLL